CRCRRAIAACLVLLPQRLPDQHCAYVCVPVGKLDDAAGNHATAIEKFGGAFARNVFDGDQPGMRPHRWANRIDDLIDANLNSAGRSWLEDKALDVRFFHKGSLKTISAFAVAISAF